MRYRLLKAVLFKSRIAFIDKYAYSRLFNTFTGDKNYIPGKFNQKYLQYLVEKELKKSSSTIMQGEDLLGN